MFKCMRITSLEATTKSELPLARLTSVKPFGSCPMVYFPASMDWPAKFLPASCFVACGSGNGSVVVLELGIGSWVGSIVGEGS